ncbi:MAG: hypothetical protein JKY56_14920 [Kofleriaceae bacterium]|nr:hypothetical protein [Kofleriaceae bacterium]
MNNLARIAMRMGAVRDALALFQEVEGLRLSSLDSGARCGVAACHALLGDMDAAQLPKKIENGNSRLTQSAFSAIVWARSCDWGKLQTLGLLWGWTIAGTEYEKHEGRVLCLLKAFAQDSSGQVCQENLTQAKPSFVDEYRYLTQDWPKLREFVAARAELSMPLPVAMLKPPDTNAE